MGEGTGGLYPVRATEEHLTEIKRDYWKALFPVGQRVRWKEVMQGYNSTTTQVRFGTVVRHHPQAGAPFLAVVVESYSGLYVEGRTVWLSPKSLEVYDWGELFMTTDTTTPILWESVVHTTSSCSASTLTVTYTADCTALS